MRKVSLTFLVIFVIGLMIPNPTVHAVTANVKDCLEDTIDCDEIVPDSKQTKQKIEKKSSVTDSLSFNLLKMVLVLLLILGLIYLLLKFLNRRHRLFHQVKTMENLGGISLGPNKSMQIVRVGPKLYLVGVGNNVELLTEITDEKMKEDILANYEERVTYTPKLFSAIVPNKEVADSEMKQKQPKFPQLFKDELNKLKENRQKLMKRQKQEEDQNE